MPPSRVRPTDPEIPRLGGERRGKEMKKMQTSITVYEGSNDIGSGAYRIYPSVRLSRAGWNILYFLLPPVVFAAIRIKTSTSTTLPYTAYIARCRTNTHAQSGTGLHCNVLV